MCRAPSMWPWRHSTGSRTSSTTSPSGRGWGTPSTATVGMFTGSASCKGFRCGLLEELGGAAVGERLAAGLAGRAVVEERVGERDLADHVAAYRARRTLAAVHGHVGLLLALELARRQPRGSFHSVAENGADGRVQRGELVVAQRAGRLERR